MEFFDDNMRRIHDAMVTDGARAAVIKADVLVRAASNEGGAFALDLVKESRQWIATACALDKQAADGEIAKLRDKINAKIGRRKAGDDLDDLLAQRNVLPMRGGG